MKVLGSVHRSGSDTLLLNVGNDPCDSFAVRVKPGTVSIAVGDPVEIKGDGRVWVKGVPFQMEPL